MTATQTEIKPLAPLPPPETLDECATVEAAVENTLGYCYDQVNACVNGDRLTTIPEFLKLYNFYDGDLRIRRSRAIDATCQEFISEHSGGWAAVIDTSQDAINDMDHHGLVEFDAAGVMHVTAKGVEIIKRDDGRRLLGDRTVEPPAVEAALNAAQTPDGDGPGTAIGYALYHPEHGFDESDGCDGEGTAISLYRCRDAAVVVRVRLGWSDEAEIIRVRIPAIAEQVTLSLEEVQRKDIRLGDTVEVETAGTSRLRVVSVDLGERHDDAVAITAPAGR